MGLKSIIRTIATACFRRKPLAASSDINTNLERCLSTFDLTFIGVGSTLGAGIYVLTGQVAHEKAGPAVVISFILAAIASILSGFCYAEFGARFPKAGSAYAYCYVALGEFFAFFIGWNIIMEYIIGASAIAKGASSYIDTLVNGTIKNGTISVLGEIHVYGLNDYFDVFAVAIVVMFTVVLSLGIKNSSRLNNFLVTLNIITLSVVSIVGFIYADSRNWNNFAPFGFRGVVHGASTCFFAFIGFDVIATTCEEAQNPGKSIPRSILGTIVIVGTAYLSVSAAVTLMVPYYNLDVNAAVSTAFSQRNLPGMKYLVGMGATIGLLGCTLVAMMAPPRLLYSMAKDGLIPSIFGMVNNRFNIPLFATVTSGVLIGLMAAILDLKALVEMLSIGTLLAYTIVDISVVVLRYQVIPTVTEESEHKPIHPNSNPESHKWWNYLREMHQSQFVINLIIFVMVLEILGACLIVDVFTVHLLVDKDPLCIIAFVILIIFILGNGIFLYRLEGNTEGLCFKVPLVPWIPMIGVAFNICLVLELGYLTWIRFIVWMTIGIIIYFVFSMHHSVERATAEVVYIPITSKENDDILTEMSEKTPLVTNKGNKFD